MRGFSSSAASIAAQSVSPASARIRALAASRTATLVPAGRGAGASPPLSARTSRSNIGSAALERRDQEEGRFAGPVEVDLFVEALGLAVVEKDEIAAEGEAPL